MILKIARESHELKLDEYKGPITRRKRKKLCISEVEKHPLEKKEKLSYMDDRED
jgi:hypothetical protein